ncbi:MAG: tRNA (N(6)-L-threonylcarbamoyladenosine(37)-C(2))-methylthiotransferase [Nitrososphaerota archaeon]|nr:tRNA (N(6)-L-threonylcarbamoyladenosine(37)-C(2))-methylthiotransferase [Nitrososphaerota archaeon]MDG7052188.1 tRNA (N(6)-L-threonylcarbamoyladenosine(37)-C(2))-methylthiotransferase [Nitrososphaerota archaeon]
MRFYLETYGCSANQSDSTIMKDLLAADGWLETPDEDEADLLIVNTCGVKKPTEDKIINRIKALNDLGRPVLISGCLPRIDPVAMADLDYSVMIDVDGVQEISDAAKRAIEGARRLRLIYERPASKPSYISSKLSTTVGVVEIQEGCAYGCTFCGTKSSRGDLYSYPADDIIRAVSRLVKAGAREVWFTGQDVAAYGDGDLPRLLRMLGTVDGEFRVRVGMMTPVFAKRIIEGLLSLFPSKSVYQFFHIPVQSGSDLVLGAMKRGYTAKMYAELIDGIRGRLNDATLSTDIIVGFPTEDAEAFEDTLKLLESTRPAVINLSKYWKRPGTEAARMKDLDSGVISSRSRMLYQMALSIMKEENERWLGWEGEAVIIERGTVKGTWVARNYAYKPIVVKQDEMANGNPLGRRITVHIEGAGQTHLKAKVTV